MKTKKIHELLLVIGLLFLLPSIFLAVFFSYPHFYTSFTVGTWLVLDYIDYRLTKTSILSYFLSKKHRDIFAFFFILATISCLLVDYIYGVKIAKLWLWVEYEPIHFVRMYIFMNTAFILGMIELYRITEVLLKKKIVDVNLLKFKINSRKRLFTTFMILGILFMMSPLYTYLAKSTILIEWIMILPFIAVIFITDSLTAFMKGKTIIERILKLNSLTILSIIITVFVGAIATESINILAGEWRYLKMPFNDLRIMDVPIAVLIGWTPLVISALSIINFIKRLDLVKDRGALQQCVFSVNIPTGLHKQSRCGGTGRRAALKMP